MLTILAAKYRGCVARPITHQTPAPRIEIALNGTLSKQRGPKKRPSVGASEHHPRWTIPETWQPSQISFALNLEVDACGQIYSGIPSPFPMGFDEVIKVRRSLFTSVEGKKWFAFLQLHWACAC